MTAPKSTVGEVKLSCRNVWKIYGDRPGAYFDGTNGNVGDNAAAHAQKIRDAGDIVASANVSFDVHVGEIFVIMGLSGSGKSTIVRCLSRLVEPTAGEILFNGQNLLTQSKQELINFRRHKMGMVFQNFGLMPHLNVLDNVAFPLELQGVPLKERQAKAQKVIDLVELTGRETSFPRELSGGQQQRVGIARSLAVEPELWFLDEPFSALDPLIRRQMQDEFLRIQSELRKSIVFITHDFLEALRIADRMAIMRDGEVVQIGRPVDLILNPADDYVREFTNDVPSEMVLTAGDIVQPGAQATPGLQAVDATTSLATLLPLLAANEDGIAVQGPGETTLGVIKARDVISALADTKGGRLEAAQ
ncbi:quaternary amine ABC transporter ATP-binding protein [Yoonia sediminilitoris]|uniref:Quaternary amine transport ATP-binding protein n=1 Tax=Yoonia sediminilitoris TaxID=1286148 RepID=A0A2T6KEZ1_9RHOB|nr:betaine/proline/choline family ABC transporter ATP-binding protein [Yoonia sediminilitoris]PUB13691.1 glycine betaine/proline transport system ATP-binding protein [Yoonia sediminilitoris]RCW94861.1 glycine betaine/proline transport system ATP-binding protein [Yoonia sediminilitoris]